MAERFTRLFTLPGNLYTDGCPVIIAAGALLKDGQSGKVLAQLKFRNIQPKTITALKVLIQPLDSINRPMEETVSYEYLDLNAYRDNEFGQKNAIYLPNASARAFSVEISEVAFTDHTIWAPSGSHWRQLAGQSRVSDKELLKEYQKHYGARAENIVLSQGDLWFCACGSINQNAEPLCHRCRQSFQNLSMCDWAALEEEKTRRLEEERAIRIVKEKSAQMAEAVRHEKKKRIAKIVIPIALLGLIILILLLTVILPKIRYNKAIGLMNAGEYESAYTLLLKLGKDEEIIKSKRDRVDALIDSGEYESAYVLLEEIGDTESIKNNKHDRAIALLASKDYDAAYGLLKEIGMDDEISASKYERATALLASEDYDAAYGLLREIGMDNEISASKYERAMALLASEDYDAAYGLLKEIGRDDEISASQYERQKENLLSADIGSYISLGSYEQDGITANGAEEIEWLVLDRNNQSILLISKQALLMPDWDQFDNDIQDIYETYTVTESSGTYWINDSARRVAIKEFVEACYEWLDRQYSDFYENAFSAEEKELLLSHSSQVRTISPEEVNLFRSESQKRVPASDYAVMGGAYRDSGNSNTCWLVLRNQDLNVATTQVLEEGVFTLVPLFAFVVPDASEVGTTSAYYWYQVCLRPVIQIDLP